MRNIFNFKKGSECRERLRTPVIKETEIHGRPPISTIKHDKLTKSALEKANRAITNIKNKLEQNLVYATASAVNDTLGIIPPKKGHKKAKQPQWERQVSTMKFKKCNISTL